MFIDCTGFAGLLISQAFKTPFVSFSENLFNDAAVAMPTPIGDDDPVRDGLHRHEAWLGVEDPAHRALRQWLCLQLAVLLGRSGGNRAARTLGAARFGHPARHLKMKIGRVTKHWNKNCLAVGLSQGFIEPLEATALLFIQQTAAVFVDFLEQGDLSEAAHAASTRTSTNTSKARATTS